jgi:hypothetical protein
MTLEFGGVTVQNNQSTAELVRGTIPTTDTSELRYTVEY